MAVPLSRISKRITASGADATGICAGLSGWALSGNSVYAVDFTTGTTEVPPDFPVLMRYGSVSEADWLEITLIGYLEGNK